MKERFVSSEKAFTPLSAKKVLYLIDISMILDGLRAYFWVSKGSQMSF